ncbi:MAG TPA: VanZ family protein [Chitinophagaceae bacterium]|nr:VanZ family protein [Chitinophagaceae bacterium]
MKKFKSFAPGIFWLFISFILLTIPGSAFSKENWLDKIWADKWIHIFLFGILTWLWCYAFYKNISTAKLLSYFVFTTLFCIFYGTAMEFVQKYCVANRSFDVGDIIADSVGAITGFGFSYIKYLKK